MTASHHATHAEPDDARQWLSDLADGRLDGEPLARRCADWGQDAEARRTWHAYHLIGDVLRSEDLANAPARDAGLLAAVRARMAAEPVLLAPAKGRAALRRVWLRPMVAAAGFVAVAGVVVVMRQADPGAAASPQMAWQGSGVLPVSTSPAPQRAIVAPSGQMLRDARLDEYLRAHRDALAGSPAALPGGAMRNVDLVASPR
jgi:sigma-E factor negative regulatory protein RseA